MKNINPLVIGFGSQAKAWSLNLRDSGVKVTVALRNTSPSKEIVTKLGFDIVSLEDEDLSHYDPILMLTPDDTHHKILELLKGRVIEGARFLYCHGFSQVKFNHSSQYPEWNHILFAIKGIASEVRFQYEINGKLGAVCSYEGLRNKADLQEMRTFLEDFAKKVGVTAGPYETTFYEEANADLFSEQSLLCSILPYASLEAYNTLRERGVSKELAYMECWMEVRSICDALMKLGPLDFFDMISPNALIGADVGERLLIDEEFKKKYQKLAQDIWSGDFYSYCDQVNIDQLRTKVKEFWSQQELQETHETLKEKLY